MWQYRARVLRVVDGDTVDAEIDLGFSLKMKDRLRLAGIDTPERGEPGWREATEALRSMVEGKSVVIHTSKDSRGKYGRMLALIFRETGMLNDDGSRELRNVNAEMLVRGLAVEYGRRGS